MFADQDERQKNIEKRELLQQRRPIHILILCFNANKHFYCLQMDSSSNAI